MSEDAIAPPPSTFRSVNLCDVSPSDPAWLRELTSVRQFLNPTAYLSLIEDHWAARRVALAAELEERAAMLGLEP